MAQCEACGGEMRGRKCPECGAVASYGGERAEKQEPRRVCPFDGSTLDANGYCHAGQGFPITLKYCPDVCPYCRRGLRWDGDCPSCLPPGEKPGHLYDPVGNGHWQITERGPQKLAPPGVALAAMEQITETLAKRLAPALTRLQNRRSGGNMPNDSD